MLTYETMLEDESTKINGFTHILDESGIKFKHLINTKLECIAFVWQILQMEINC